MLISKAITKDAIDFFSDKKIYFNWSPKHRGLQIGQSIIYDDSHEIEPYVGFFADGRVLCRMGSFSYSNTAFISPNLVVGRYCSIAHNLKISGHRHPYEFVSSSNFTFDRDTTTVSNFIDDHDSEYNNFPEGIPQKPYPVIGDDVWVGQDVTINCGIHIGTGAIIAGGAVVTNNIGPYEVVGGNPAKLIKKRFDDDVIATLLQTAWWNYAFTDFKKLSINDPRIFCEEFLRLKNELCIYQPDKIKLALIP